MNVKLFQKQQQTIPPYFFISSSCQKLQSQVWPHPILLYLDHCLCRLSHQGYRQLQLEIIHRTDLFYGEGSAPFSVLAGFGYLFGPSRCLVLDGPLLLGVQVVLGCLLCYLHKLQCSPCRLIIHFKIIWLQVIYIKSRAANPKFKPSDKNLNKWHNKLPKTYLLLIIIIKYMDLQIDSIQIRSKNCWLLLPRTFMVFPSVFFIPSSHNFAALLATLSEIIADTYVTILSFSWSTLSPFWVVIFICSFVLFARTIGNVDMVLSPLTARHFSLARRSCG